MGCRAFGVVLAPEPLGQRRELLSHLLRFASHPAVAVAFLATQGRHQQLDQPQVVLALDVAFEKHVDHGADLSGVRRCVLLQATAQLRDRPALEHLPDRSGELRRELR